ncbi:DUF1207 domain-containing protein [Nitrosomonas eutropha]|uniref:DUF1207 domain-containing protein n=2 Tax=Nitrosomonas eutropha TaxID=916 RepID=Q0AFH7_NITEC|nr:DUF1207 domain-containing protein [Nitrosomonas eutropha]ABI59905.1 protein of unknown function DUF1207 [Nitrosomonas eutropha C91]
MQKIHETKNSLLAQNCSNRTLRKFRHVMRILLTIIVSLACISTASAAITDDSYIAGYATGILKYELKSDTPSLTVRNGNITLSASEVLPEDHARITQVLLEIPGVTGVNIKEPTDQQPITTTSPAPSDTVTEEEKNIPTTDDPTILATGILPSGYLFKPLLADPRWAHFSAAYRNYLGGNIDGDNNAAVSFGETLPFYRANFGKYSAQWEVGLQAGVFSDFNLDAPSSDLINTDFIASIYSSMRAGNASAFARIYHQSSHLGDEFLLRKLTDLDRVNLSYEGIDLRLSYELPYGVRVYGGGGGIFHKEPSTIKPWSIQYGIEFRSPWRLDIAPVRPVLAIDIKNYEQNNWNADLSVKAGFQFEDFQVFGRRLQFFAEYFNGNSPTGQFFKEKVDYMGIGAHYHF